MGWDDSNNDNNKGRRNPWGQQQNRPEGGPPRGGRGGPSDQQPDLDQLLRNFQNNMNGMLPGEGGAGKFVALGVGLIGLLWLASGLYIVNPGEQAVVQRFGAWDRTRVEEGLGYHLPYPVETLSKVKVNEIRNLTIGFIGQGGRDGGSKRDIAEESLMLTADRNIVDLDLTVQWNIKSAEDFLFKVQDQEATIKQVAESAIREAVGQTPMFSTITTGRADVASKAREIIQKNLDEYHSGVNITQVLIQSAEVHPDVQAAFQDVQSAKQDAEDVQNQAQAYREDILPRARGNAIQQVQQAQGYREATVAKAKGDAARFESIYEAYQQGPDVTKQRLYIETMEDVLKNAQKIIIDDNGKQGVVPYLPLNELNRKQDQQ